MRVGVTTVDDGFIGYYAIIEDGKLVQKTITGTDYDEVAFRTITAIKKERDKVK